MLITTYVSSVVLQTLINIFMFGVLYVIPCIRNTPLKMTIAMASILAVIAIFNISSAVSKVSLYNTWPYYVSTINTLIFSISAIVQLAMVFSKCGTAAKVFIAFIIIFHSLVTLAYLRNLFGMPKKLSVEEQETLHKFLEKNFPSMPQKQIQDILNIVYWPDTNFAIFETIKLINKTTDQNTKDSFFSTFKTLLQLV